MNDRLISWTERVRLISTWQWMGVLFAWKAVHDAFRRFSRVHEDTSTAAQSATRFARDEIQSSQVFESTKQSFRLSVSVCK